MRGERGGGRLNLFFWLIVVAVGIFAAMRIIPVRIAVTELHDYVDTRLQAETVSGKFDEKRFVEGVLAKARALELPLTRKQISVDVFPGEVRARLQHQVTVDLEVYEWVWTYDESYEHMKL